MLHVKGLELYYLSLKETISRLGKDSCLTSLLDGLLKSPLKCLLFSSKCYCSVAYCRSKSFRLGTGVAPFKAIITERVARDQKGTFIYLCLSIYAYLSMSVYLCLSIYTYLSMPIYPCLSIYAYLSMPIYLSIYPYLCPSIYVCLSIPTSMSVYLCLSIDAYLSMPIYPCLSIYAFLSIPTYLCLSIHAYLSMLVCLYLSIYVCLSMLVYLYLSIYRYHDELFQFTNEVSRQ